ncbi:zinc-dependent alcohol dehydrogenase [Actinoallomurus rhizosphaericola]|uniref:zinc-dependent alcohol dehydrogenase n=1 Tax=Actinoallomurus rhizosphaericola TaxID=2952536 RepID=UPI002093FF2A|nr:alcohol dehydrogenase catalytic domain-containing protein [Actinoallomurus rhizosphaericola]MCO5995507.1 alcohol dehydrogenase catalytic domain-containing protein [Actinoallomurus rhizosphaericola]
MVTIRPPGPPDPCVPAAMRAAVLFGPGDLRVVDRPVPEPRAGEVLVRVAMCGTCGTDLKILDGHFPQTPPYGEHIPGHEWTGTVVATGSTVDEVAPGDRVCIEAHHGCGRCGNCLTGRYTACLNYGDPAKGHRATGMTSNGGFAQYAVHHVSALYRLPARVTDEDAVLITTAGTGLYGLDTAGAYIAGQDVAVFGPGPVGLMTAQVCKRLGATRVILVGTRESRLRLGRELGADHALNAREVDPVGTVLDLTDGLGVDLAIEASGSPDVPEQCGRVTRRGGKILFLAYYPEPVRLDLSAIVRKDITMYTARGEGGDNVRRAVALAAAGMLRAGELVTHRFPLEDIAEAFRVLRERDGDPLKIVIVP